MQVYALLPAHARPPYLTSLQRILPAKCVALQLKIRDRFVAHKPREKELFPALFDRWLFIDVREQ